MRLSPAVRGLVTLAGTWVGMSAAGVAQQPGIPGPSFRDVIGLRGAGSPAIAPDGRSIAFTLTSTDWDQNRYDTEVWLVRGGDAPVQVTRTTKGSSTDPQWSPDGTWLAFLADRGDKQQVFLIRPGGGEAVALTAMKQGVTAYRWSP
ncbi:MAG TPA: LpqB family beta-propeller domain-containing protein, partial [Gemmatimonadales bacterium]|nr:LpqB family beta-propeller domain-containing protein [Gemmatimonadales bacterium]